MVPMAWMAPQFPVGLDETDGPDQALSSFHLKRVEHPP